MIINLPYITEEHPFRMIFLLPDRNDFTGEFVRVTVLPLNGLTYKNIAPLLFTLLCPLYHYQLAVTMYLVESHDQNRHSLHPSLHNHDLN